KRVFGKCAAMARRIATRRRWPIMRALQLGILSHSMHDRDEHDADSPAYDGPSRSQRRREALDVLKLAQALALLSDAQLAHVPLDENIRAEVQRTRAVTQQIARKRQTQYLAKQMRKLDDSELDAIRATLEHDRDAARRETAALHRVETWRE